ncbi:MAG: hypothetical protein JNN01_09850 [Opitutaceae bacterium]|nr:hypothetical protein [Opitutaceae bacterium]
MQDLHLYAGLFVSPYVLVFAASVFFLVHRDLSVGRGGPTVERIVRDLPLPANLNQLSGRARIDALRPALDRAGVQGEVGWIQHIAKDNRLVVPVMIPGRTTTVTIDLFKREASISGRSTGLPGALVELHKSPGPHLVGLRMNWWYMWVWYWLSDATVYLVLLVSVSGLYLWYHLRSERRIGTTLLAVGALSFTGLIYALVH